MEQNDLNELARLTADLEALTARLLQEAREKNKTANVWRLYSIGDSIRGIKLLLEGPGWEIKE